MSLSICINKGVIVVRWW